jgi:hypothetical protein
MAGLLVVVGTACGTKPAGFTNPGRPRSCRPHVLGNETTERISSPGLGPAPRRAGPTWSELLGA